MGPNDILSKGFVADTAVPLYYAVRQTDTEHMAVANTAGQFVLGICQEEISAEDATVGRVARIRVMGISRGVAGAAIARGARLTVAADGRLVTAAPAAGANANVVGVALTATTAAGEWLDVLLTPGASLQG